MEGDKQENLPFCTQDDKTNLSVDIVILSWDRTQDTLCAIRSALGQRGLSVNVIVVDQGSQPENIKLLKAFAESHKALALQFMFLKKNSGVPGGRNIAINKGNAPYIIALDNDAEFFDQYQALKAVELMESDSQLGAMGFRIRCFGEIKDDLSSWSYSNDAQRWAGKPFSTAHFVGAGHIIRRSAFEKAGGYDSVLFFMLEERDLCFRIINADFAIRYEPSVIVCHKVSPEHRVSWGGKRWEYNVRNSLYIQMKQNKSLIKLLFTMLMFFRKGYRTGLIRQTLNGILKALKLWPEAIQQRKAQPLNLLSQKAIQYIEECEGIAGLSRWQRLKRRFASSNKPLR